MRKGDTRFCFFKKFRPYYLANEENRKDNDMATLPEREKLWYAEVEKLKAAVQAHPNMSLDEMRDRAADFLDAVDRFKYEVSEYCNDYKQISDIQKSLEEISRRSMLAEKDRDIEDKAEMQDASSRFRVDWTAVDNYEKELIQYLDSKYKDLDAATREMTLTVPDGPESRKIKNITKKQTKEEKDFNDLKAQRAKCIAKQQECTKGLFHHIRAQKLQNRINDLDDKLAEVSKNIEMLKAKNIEQEQMRNNYVINKAIKEGALIYNKEKDAYVILRQNANFMSRYKIDDPTKAWETMLKGKQAFVKNKEDGHLVRLKTFDKVTERRLEHPHWVERIGSSRSNPQIAEPERTRSDYRRPEIPEVKKEEPKAPQYIKIPPKQESKVKEPEKTEEKIIDKEAYNRAALEKIRQEKEALRRERNDKLDALCSPRNSVEYKQLHGQYPKDASDFRILCDVLYKGDQMPIERDFNKPKIDYQFGPKDEYINKMVKSMNNAVPNLSREQMVYNFNFVIGDTYAAYGEKAAKEFVARLRESEHGRDYMRALPRGVDQMLYKEVIRERQKEQIKEQEKNLDKTKSQDRDEKGKDKDYLDKDFKPFKDKSDRDLDKDKNIDKDRDVKDDGKDKEREEGERGERERD